MRRTDGFTLVELVMVIVLLGIVATISVQFVALSTRGAIDTGDRQQRSLKAVVVGEQITRMLREAFPLSVRVTGPTSNCLEWLPIAGATTYTSLPSAGDTTIEAIPFSRVPGGAGLRAVVYGYGGAANRFYNAPVVNPGPISPTIANLDNTTVPALVTLSSAHRFDSTSPTRRLFVVSRPKALCSETGVLVLYQNYDVGDPYTDGRRDILAANLVGNAQFTFVPATLRRAAVVHFSFELGTPGSTETLDVSQEVQIRNVP
ncbi:type II secretion system protein [Marinobacter sp. M1N3S26]|uniref:type II secretion system protein n=1 Tax=Marinobacter sp. M1N3S26 TaxID=3382299 RepID=UPI00387AFB15